MTGLRVSLAAPPGCRCRSLIAHRRNTCGRRRLRHRLFEMGPQVARDRDQLPALLAQFVEHGNVILAALERRGGDVELHVLPACHCEISSWRLARARSAAGPPAK